MCDSRALADDQLVGVWSVFTHPPDVSHLSSLFQNVMGFLPVFDFDQKEAVIAAFHLVHHVTKK